MIALAVCLLAVALPAAPVQAQGEYILLLLSPDEGVPGEEITVYGYNFTPDNQWVDIYYFLNDDWVWVAEDQTDEDGYFRVNFIVPESCTGLHDVRAEDRYVEDYDEFTVEPGLTIDPQEGPVGTTVTVEGHGFAQDEDDIELLYYLDGTTEVVADNIEATEHGYWQASVQVPSSVRGDHDIDAQGAVTEPGDVDNMIFEVIPEISIIDPSSGSVIEEPSGTVGESIAITGSGFDSEDSYIKVLFEGEEAETDPEIIRADENGDWEASFQVPDMPAGTYSVTAEGQSTREQDVNDLTFTIAPGLLLSPDEGHVGMNVTVRGGGFIPDDVVVIKYEGSEVETARTNEEGIFEASFLVPESKHGARNVTAEADGETEAYAIFIMENDAPDMPELIAPPDGDRLGFIGKATPTFNWSQVSDDSGVYYSLQIATSDNVTSAGEFADPILTVEGLVAANYTLAKTEALPYGTYYWIVQAVDGADNGSGWTEASLFRVGRLPIWAFIVIIVAAAAGIGALVYFRIIRRRVYYY
jgi:hypothetical protein